MVLPLMRMSLDGWFSLRSLPICLVARPRVGGAGEGGGSTGVPTHTMK